MRLLTSNEQPGAFPDSYYVSSSPTPPDREVLKGTHKADVCVIGGGFTGVSAALHLAQAGLSVVLLEAHRVGWGASGRNGGQLGSGQRQEQPELEATYGRDDARAMWDIACESVSTVKRLIANNNISCGLKSGIIHTNHRARYNQETRELVEHMAQHYDYPLKYLEPDALRAEVKSPKYSAGVLDMGSNHLHPLNCVRGLSSAAEKAGVRIFEMSEVVRIEQNSPNVVHTSEGSVTAEYVVLGCNGYLDQLMGQVSRRVMPINNFIIATEPLSPDQVSGIMANDYAVADSKFVVNYFRFSEDKRLLFGGRESYGYKFPKDIKGFVRKAMVDIFPQTADLRIDYGWGGTLAITRNRLPYLTRITPTIYNASGYSGHGVGMATMSGRIVAEAIKGQTHRFDIMSKIETKPFPGGLTFRNPLLVAAMLWYSLLDRI